jgi:hypothetical protein
LLVKCRLRQVRAKAAPISVTLVLGLLIHIFFVFYEPSARSQSSNWCRLFAPWNIEPKQANRSAELILVCATIRRSTAAPALTGYGCLQKTFS